MVPHRRYECLHGAEIWSGNPHPANCRSKSATMEDAARIAYRELARWLASDYGFDELEAYFLHTQTGRVQLGNTVDPKYTVGASILKNYVKA